MPARSEKEIYRARRREGKPCHSSTSITIMILAGLAALLNLIALLVPYWRSNYQIMLGYMNYRHWGLFAVQGRTRKMHHVMMTDNCGYWGGLMLGGLCQSPICLWYKLKCEVYFELMCVSYGCAAGFIIGFIIHLISLVNTARLNPRSLKVASRCWPLSAILHLACVITYFILTEEMFEELDAKSTYPTPDPGLSMYATFIATIMLVAISVLGFSLSGMWPEEHEIESSDSDDDDEKDEGDDAFLRVAGQAQMPPAYGAIPQGQGPPAYGYAPQPGQAHAPQTMPGPPPSTGPPQ